MDTELIFTISMVFFGILFIVWIFWKCHSDNKKEKAILTELYQKYGVRTNAAIINCQKHVNMQRTMPYKYELSVKFSYNSPAKNCLCPCTAKVLTNNPDCRYCKTVIPIIYIPQYADYLNEFIGSKEIRQYLGINVYQYSDKMLLWVDDMSIFTNLSEI